MDDRHRMLGQQICGHGKRRYRDEGNAKPRTDAPAQAVFQGIPADGVDSFLQVTDTLGVNREYRSCATNNGRLSPSATKHALCSVTNIARCRSARPEIQ
jgi:hypothetical protein